MKAELLALAERVEAATGADRAIDYDIAHFVTRAHMESGKAPAYTASLDAAMTLVPDDWHAQVSGCNDSWHVRLTHTPSASLGQVTGFTGTPALALCAAALRVRAAQMEGENDRGD